MQLACVFIFGDREHTKVEDNMSQTKTMGVRISNELSEFVAANVGDNGMVLPPFQRTLRRLRFELR